MKKVIGLIAVLAFGWAGSVSAATIKEGETFVFKFDALPLCCDAYGYNASATLGLNYSDENRFGPSESMIVSWYEDSLEDVPFVVRYCLSKSDFFELET